MRIQKIIVKNLFGMFDHEINLNLDERITIIIGENGIGKTIILRLIKELFDNDLSENFYKIPFDCLKIIFDDYTELCVKKNSSVLFEVFYGNEKANVTLEPRKKIIGLGQPYYEYPKTPFYYVWFTNIIEQINIKLVETQRLITINEEEKSLRQKLINPLINSKIINTTEKYAENLADKIKQKLAESASLSQSLDSTFPTRLIEKTIHPLDEESIKKTLKKLEDKRVKLVQAGILDKQENIEIFKHKIDESKLDKAQRNVFTVYIEDVEKKLEIFDDLAKKINLFLEIINKRFKYKKMSINKEQGFIFRNIKNQEVINSSDLSSGEQHELVLLYELLFLVKPDSLVMIDEPELSLHVAWQLDFLEDFQKISELSQIDLLIATHSPQIINDRRDLAVVLDGNRNG